MYASASIAALYSRPLSSRPPGAPACAPREKNGKTCNAAKITIPRHVTYRVIRTLRGLIETNVDCQRGVHRYARGQPGNSVWSLPRGQPSKGNNQLVMTVASATKVAALRVA